MPGSINSPLTKGCHNLIKQGAKLAETRRRHPRGAEAARAHARAAPRAAPRRRRRTPCSTHSASIRATSTRSPRAAASSADALAALLTRWEIEGLDRSAAGRPLSAPALARRARASSARLSSLNVDRFSARCLRCRGFVLIIVRSFWPAFARCPLVSGAHLPSFGFEWRKS